MEKKNLFYLLKESWLGLLLPVLIGLGAYTLKITTKSSLVDPLLFAMIIGIIIRTGMKERSKLKIGILLAPRIFIPIGVVFYGAENLNFVKYSHLNPSILLLLVFVMLVYFSVISFLGKKLGQKKEITYLTATGSAICGASAIAIVSPVVEADPDDTSISLLSVALAATVGLFIFLPFLATLFNITNRAYGLLSGSVLQFTGFVKAAAQSVPYLSQQIPAKDTVALALSIKAGRYLGLLIAMPLFASLVKKKFYIPWFLWSFLAAGILGSWLYAAHEGLYLKSLLPVITPTYNISWAIAMAAVGLNADVKQLLSNNGTKALVMAFSGCIAAIATFFVGAAILHLL